MWVREFCQYRRKGEERGRIEPSSAWGDSEDHTRTRSSLGESPPCSLEGFPSTGAQGCGPAQGGAVARSQRGG